MRRKTGGSASPTAAGRVDGETVVELEAATVGQLLRDPDGLERAAARETGTTFALDEVDLAPAVPDPDKIVCVGSNYHDHIKEMGRTPPDHPAVFAKYRRALAGPGDDLVLPDGDAGTTVDWECELAVVIGRSVRNVSGDEALDAVAGYCVFNDVSVRGWQRRTHQFLAGKTWEGLSPLGPGLVTRDQLAAGDGSGLRISTTVNGQVMQDSSTSELVFGVVELITDLSRIVTLDPGDVIATGTPGGVGAAMDPPRFLKAGDEVITEIEGIGRLVNRCR